MLTILLGLVVLVVLPATVALWFHLGDVFRYGWHAARRRIRQYRLLPGRGWRERRGFARLDRAMRERVAVLPTRPTDPPIERVAADLRRLGAERLANEPRSASWQTIVQRVYDDRLRTACRQLDLAEYLSGLSGVDREIERLRIVDALAGAGLAVTPAPARRPNGD